MAQQHPSIDDTILRAVVYQAAVELVSTIADPERLKDLLQRRADARLMALTGVPVPIRSTRSVSGR